MTYLIMFRWMKKQPVMQKKNNNQEYKYNERHTFTIKISMKTVISIALDNHSCTVVYGIIFYVLILLKHLRATLKHNFEQFHFYSLHLIRYSDSK